MRVSTFTAWLCVGALVHGLHGCGRAPASAGSAVSAGMPAGPVDSAVVVPASRGHLRPAVSVSQTKAVAADFQRFALNALLVPLLDDDVPERWADPSLSLECDDAEVRVDGAPPEIGAPVGDGFTLQWRLDRCVPFGEHIELSGEVELQVTRVGSRYVALVRPRGLRVASSAGTEVLVDEFGAELTNSPGLPR